MATTRDLYPIHETITVKWDHVKQQWYAEVVKQAYSGWNGTFMVDDPKEKAEPAINEFGPVEL